MGIQECSGSWAVAGCRVAARCREQTRISGEPYASVERVGRGRVRLVRAKANPRLSVRVSSPSFIHISGFLRAREHKTQAQHRGESETL